MVFALSYRGRRAAAPTVLLLALGCLPAPAALTPDPSAAGSRSRSSPRLQWKIAGCYRVEHQREAAHLGSSGVVEPDQAVCARNVDTPRLWVSAPPAAVVSLERLTERGASAPPLLAEPAPGFGPSWQQLEVPGDGRFLVSAPSTGGALELWVRPFVRRPPLHALRLVDVLEARAVTATREARGLLAIAHPAAQVLDVFDGAEKAHLARRAGELFLEAGRPEEAAVAHEIALFYADPLEPAVLRRTFASSLPPDRWLLGQWHFHKARAHVALWHDLVDLARDEALAASDIARHLDDPEWWARSATYLALVAAQAGEPVDRGLFQALFASVDDGRLSGATAQWVLTNLGWVRWLASIDLLASTGLSGAASATEILLRAIELPSFIENDSRSLYLNLALAAAHEGERAIERRARRWLGANAPAFLAPWENLLSALSASAGRARAHRLQRFESLDPGVEWLRLHVLATLLEPSRPAEAIRVLESALAGQSPSASVFRVGSARSVREKLVALLHREGRALDAYRHARAHVRSEHALLLSAWGAERRLEEPSSPPLPTVGPSVGRLLVERFRQKTLAFLAVGDAVHVEPIGEEARRGAALGAALEVHASRLAGLRRLEVVWTHALAGVALSAFVNPVTGRALMEEREVAWTLDLGAPKPEGRHPDRHSDGRAASSLDLVTLVDVKGLTKDGRPAAERLARRGRQGSGAPEDFGDARHLLFLGHGLSSPGDPFGARIFFEGREMRAASLVALSRVSPVLGLFACAAGGGRNAQEKGRTRMLGVAQALLFAGAHAVVAPKEEIEERAALTLASTWVEALTVDGEPSSAFRRAWREAARAGSAVEGVDLWLR